MEPMITLLVTRPAPHTLPPVYSYEEVMQQTGFKKRVKTGEIHKSVILKPGRNKDVVTAKYWDLVKGKCEGAIEAGWLKEIAADEAIDPELDTVRLIRKQTVKDAKLAINAESNTDMLEGWYEADDRPQVRTAIKARLTEMV